MAKMEDFRVDGKIDWNAYKAAKVAVGESCCDCNSSLFPAKGVRSQCRQCVEFDTSTGEFSGDRVRCPFCRKEKSLDDYYEVYEGGEHNLECGACDKQFTIHTHVKYTFTSPAMGETEPV